LRAKLILLKSVEVSALILLLVTAVNMERMGKLDFFPNNNKSHSSDLLHPPVSPPTWHGNAVQDTETRSTNTTQGEKKNITSSNSENLFTENTSTNSGKNNAALDAISAETAVEKVHLKVDPAAIQSGVSDGSDDMPGKVSSILNADQENASNSNIVSRNQSLTAALPLIDMQGLSTTAGHQIIPNTTSIHDDLITEPLDMIADGQLQTADLLLVPAPSYIKPKPRKYAEFGILAQSDYNGLRMPEDRLYTAGQQIIFPQQGIMSH
jgi:hypothetical protein